MAGYGVDTYHGSSNISGPGRPPALQAAKRLPVVHRPPACAHPWLIARRSGEDHNLRRAAHPLSVKECAGDKPICQTTYKIGRLSCLLQTRATYLGQKWPPLNNLPSTTNEPGYCSWMTMQLSALESRN